MFGIQQLAVSDLLRQVGVICERLKHCLCLLRSANRSECNMKNVIDVIDYYVEYGTYVATRQHVMSKCAYSRLFSSLFSATKVRSSMSHQLQLILLSSTLYHREEFLLECV